MGLEYWAGVILVADIGFLTPVSVFNVPEINLPMHVGETSEMACAKVRLREIADHRSEGWPLHLRVLPQLISGSISKGGNDAEIHSPGLFY